MAADTYKIGSAITTIQNLADEPTESAAQLKAKFDEGAETVRLQHDLLCDYVDATLATKTELAAAVLSGILDDSITNAKMAADVKIGSLAALTTTDKDSITDAINEIETDVTDLNANDAVLYYGKFSQMSGGDAKSASGVVTFTAEDNDDFAAINIPVNATRITIPSGITKAKFYWEGSIKSSRLSGLTVISLCKNGVALKTLAGAWGYNGDSQSMAVGKFESSPIAVSAGEYYTLNFAAFDAEAALTAGSVFGMEVLG